MNLLEDLARIYDLNEDSVGIVMEKMLFSFRYIMQLRIRR